jgi:hypothetical protein
MLRLRKRWAALGRPTPEGNVGPQRLTTGQRCWPLHARKRRALLCAIRRSCHGRPGHARARAGRPWHKIRFALRNSTATG